MFVSYSASTLYPTEALVTYSGALEATESGRSGPSACPLKALHVLTLGRGARGVVFPPHLPELCGALFTSEDFELQVSGTQQTAIEILFCGFRTI